MDRHARCTCLGFPSRLRRSLLKIALARTGAKTPPPRRTVAVFFTRVPAITASSCEYSAATPEQFSSNGKEGDHICVPSLIYALKGPDLRRASVTGTCSFLTRSASTKTTLPDQGFGAPGRIAEPSSKRPGCCSCFAPQPSLTASYTGRARRF